MSSLNPRTPLIWLLLPMIGGYSLSMLFPGLPRVFIAVGGCALAILALIWAYFLKGRWQPLWAILATGAGICLSAAYYAERMHSPPGWEELPLREANLTVRIDRIFQSSYVSDRTHGIATIIGVEDHLADLRGARIHFNVRRNDGEQPWPRFTTVEMTGILQRLPHESRELDGFDRYLARSGAHFRLSRIGRREVSHAAPWFFRFSADQRDRLDEFLSRGLNDDSPVTAVYVAMLLGKQAELCDDLREAFLRTGTLHLFAISGLHIGVVALAINMFFLLLRAPPRIGAAIGLGLLMIFVEATGATPSATRAFLMVLFFWGARFIGRQPSPAATLANSAVVVLLFFPDQLWSPGFQLSYAVVAGILFLGLPLADVIWKRWTPFSLLPAELLDKKQQLLQAAWRWTTTTACISASATLLSSPLSIHYSGIFAPGGVILNMLLVPASSLVIIAGFASVVAGLFGIGFMSAVFNHAGGLVIVAMTFLVERSLWIPGFFWNAAYRSGWMAPTAAGVLLGSLFVCSWRRWRRPCFHFYVPFLLFALILLLGARLTFLGDAH